MHVSLIVAGKRNAGELVERIQLPSARDLAVQIQLDPFSLIADVARDGFDPYAIGRDRDPASLPFVHSRRESFRKKRLGKICGDLFAVRGILSHDRVIPLIAVRWLRGVTLEAQGPQRMILAEREMGGN